MGSPLQFMLFNDLALIYWTFYGVIAVAITPNLIGAAVISGAFYGLSNLFAGKSEFQDIARSPFWEVITDSAPT